MKSKLNNEKITDILTRHKQGESKTVLSKEYMVSYNTVSNLINCKTFKNFNRDFLDDVKAGEVEDDKVVKKKSTKKSRKKKKVVEIVEEVEVMSDDETVIVEDDEMESMLYCPPTADLEDFVGGYEEDEDQIEYIQVQAEIMKERLLKKIIKQAHILLQNELSQ